MFRKILLPLDGSTFAEHAIPHAVQAARSAGAELLLALVHVQRVPVTTDHTLRHELQRWEEEYLVQEQRYLQDVAERIGREHGITPRTMMSTGEVDQEIERAVRREQVDLVAMTTHGRAGMERAWLGSVADSLVRGLEVPVLLVRPSDEAPVAPPGGVGYGHVLVALDGSERAERAIAPALALRGDGGRLTLLRVAAAPSAVTSPFLPHAAQQTREQQESRRARAAEYLEGQRRRLGDGDAAVETVVVVDYHPARAILKYALDHGADLVALGTHGRGPVGRLVLGSVSDKIVRASDVPVLVC